MRVLVLLAGVVDPKWRLDGLALDEVGRAREAGLPRRLSPFDEAALETALQLRDADPTLHLTVALRGDAAAEALLRHIMALKPDRALRFEDAAPAFDPASLLASLQAVLAATGPADLVLTGREFGDADDGVLPPLLAETLGCRFFGPAHLVRSEGASLRLRRLRGPGEEEAVLPMPLLASITNDRGNRLRHPLLKNVMLAKRAPAEVLLAAPAAAATLRPLALAPAVPAERAAGACRMLEGSRAEQIAALAALLREARDG